MQIQLRKFGMILTARQAGREAVAAFQPSLRDLRPEEPIEIDFTGVVSLSPSWAQEFLEPLRSTYGARLRLLPSTNPSVRVTLQLLDQIRGASAQDSQLKKRGEEPTV